MRLGSMRTGLAVLACMTIAQQGGATPGLAADRAAPATALQPVTDRYHGVAVRDPYRWLEDGSSPRVAVWSAAQNSRTRAYLDRLPVRAMLHDRIMAAASQTSPSYHSLTMAGGRLFTADVQPEEFARVLVTNALSPLKIIEALDEGVPRDGAIVAMTSTLGSVAGNTGGGTEVYRASKAALNTLLAQLCLAASAARDHRDASWLGAHRHGRRECHRLGRGQRAGNGHGNRGPRRPGRMRLHRLSGADHPLVSGLSAAARMA